MSGRGDGLAGSLRERVTIARQAGGADVLGDADGAWTILAVRWASVLPDGTGDAVAGDATSAVARFRVTLREGPAVLPGDRIGWAGRTLRVRAIVEDPALPDRIVLRVEEQR